MLEPAAQLPSRIGKYRIIRHLASGGMAEVFLAVLDGERGFRKVVVVKRILPKFADDESFLTMFDAEARLAATLHHPNVAQIHDFGVADGRAFYTMEYVEGTDVRRLFVGCKRLGQPFPLEHALTIVAGAAAGLHHAHEKCDASGAPLGVVHRDISPSNVLVSYEGAVKVIDFGISKAMNVEGDATRTGTLKGKVPYMSPEQVRGTDVDRRSDVFALGSVLYQLTTGRRPFEADNDVALIGKIALEPIVPPSEGVEGYPPELETIVLHALAQNRDQRYASAEDLKLDLERFALARSIHLSSTGLGRFAASIVPRAALQIPDLDSVNTTPISRSARMPKTRGTDTRPLEDVDVLDAETEISVSEPALAATLAVEVAPLFQAPSRSMAAAAALPMRPRVSPAAVAMGALLGAGVIVAGVLLMRESPRVAEPVRTTTMPDAAPLAARHDAAPPTPDVVPVVLPEVAVTLAITPADVELTVDGELRGDNPVRLPRSDTVHLFKFSAKGYLQETRKVRANADVTVNLQLKRPSTTPGWKDPFD